MTVNEVKKELAGYRNNKLILELSWERIKRLEAKLEYAGGSFLTERVQSSVRKTFEDRLTELLDMKIEYMGDWIDSEKRQKRIIGKINSLGQPYSSILTLLYIEGYSLLQTSAKLNYAYTWACKLHSEALKKYIELG